MKFLGALNDGDSVEFDVETNEYKKFHAAGFIRNIKLEEQGVGTLMRTRYSFQLQYAH
jgi:hypothetical protein